MMNLALSTMWGIGRFPSLSGFLETARDLGFDRIELNHGVTPAMLDSVDLAGFSVTSIHEPCPTDPSVDELKRRNWLVSAAEEENRQHAVGIARRSIDLARRLGAQVVVIHLGQVDMDRELETTVVDLYTRGRSGEPQYARATEKLRAARAARANVNMRSVRRSLLELAEYASRLGVRLGLENRYHYPAIPLPDELDELLRSGFGDVAGYWHDVGHAQALENLGFGTHREWLQRFGQRMVGVHLHDIEGIRDHLTPGLGHLDWNLVARNLPAAVIRTCEFQNDNSPQEVAAGIGILVEKGIATEVRES